MRLLVSRLLFRQRGFSSIFAFGAATMGTGNKKTTLCLFDVDGTLTLPRQRMTVEVEDVLAKLKSHAAVGLVGGSDLCKIAEQTGGMECLKKYDYVFSENGLVAYKNGNLFHTQSIASYLNEEKLQQFINFCLRYLSDLQLPFKRGTFIEFRKGMINISPVGRNCTQEERDTFEGYDKEHKVREVFIAAISEKFASLNLEYSIGGQISFDVFPKGWDKTYTLNLVETEGFEEIHFFGDKTSPGGNDCQIYNDKRVKGHTVKNFEDTVLQVTKLFSL